MPNGRPNIQMGQPVGSTQAVSAVDFGAVCLKSNSTMVTERRHTFPDFLFFCDGFYSYLNLFLAFL